MNVKENEIKHDGNIAKQPAYVRFDREIAIDFGIPEDLYGPEELVHFVVDTRIYTITPESPIGRLTNGTGDQAFELTAPIYRRAIRLQEVIDDFPTGRVIYMMLSKVPMGMFGWSQTPLEVVESSPDTEFQFVEGSLAEALNDPTSRTLVIDVEQFWKNNGADVQHRTKKPHRIKRYNLP